MKRECGQTLRFSAASLSDGSHCSYGTRSCFSPGCRAAIGCERHAWGLPYVATALGARQVYAGRYLPDTLLTLIQQEHVTFSHCVPTILHMMLTSPASRNRDLSGWKVIIGGSALPTGLGEVGMGKGSDVFRSYGMLETGAVFFAGPLQHRTART